MITKNSMNVIKEYDLPVVRNGVSRIFTIMEKSIGRAKKVFNEKFQPNGWKLGVDPLSERVGLSVDRRFFETHLIEPQFANMRVLNRISTSTEDVDYYNKLSGELDNWLD